MSYIYLTFVERDGENGFNLLFLCLKALKKLPREKVQLATKFGVILSEDTQVQVKGSPGYVRQCCEASLKRLGVEYIDLYYQHRVDISVPIEDTVSSRRSHLFINSNGLIFSLECMTLRFNGLILSENRFSKEDGGAKKAG